MPQTIKSEDEDIGVVLGTKGEDWVDATHSVEEYENGKTFSCECGQGFGVDFEIAMVKCPSCGRNVVDKDWESRSSPDRADGQQAITDWV